MIRERLYSSLYIIIYRNVCTGRACACVKSRMRVGCEKWARGFINGGGGGWVLVSLRHQHTHNATYYWYSRVLFVHLSLSLSLLEMDGVLSQHTRKRQHTHCTRLTKHAEYIYIYMGGSTSIIIIIVNFFFL
jgi:hypothetical protein